MQGSADKDKWIDDTLNSIKGMQRIPADPLMYDKVMNRLNEQSSVNGDRVRTLLPRIAVAAALLLIVNIASIIHVTKKQQTVTEQAGVYQVVSEEINATSENNF